MNETQGPITVSVMRRVKPGCEADFEAALQAFVPRSLALPGQLGVNLLRPAPNSGSREFGILRRFADKAAMDLFYNSVEFQEYSRQVEALIDGEPRYERVSGLETWFTPPGRRAIIPPPRWKMALVTFSAVFPLSLILNYTVGPLLGYHPSLLVAFVLSIIKVPLLTWMVMPTMTRLLRRWLYPQEPG